RGEGACGRRWIEKRRSRTAHPVTGDDECDPRERDQAEESFVTLLTERCGERLPKRGKGGGEMHTQEKRETEDQETHVTSRERRCAVRESLARRRVRVRDGASF